MEIRVERAGDVELVEPHGRIDSASAKEFGDHLTAAINSGSLRLVVDLKHILYISSAGFRSLLIARKLVDQTGGTLILCGLSAEVKRTFELGAFTELFTICATRDEALAKAR